METDVPYMEMRANFNLIFLKNFIWKLFKASEYPQKIKNVKTTCCIMAFQFN